MSLNEKLMQMFPGGQDTADWLIVDGRIAYWNQSLGQQPTIEQIELVGLPPIRRLTPFDFIARFTDAELVAIQTSVDPIVIRGRTKLQTIITYVDLDAEETQMLIGYLSAIGLLTQERAAEILS